jgi:diguanylate cyclase (GGDEF)-like protein/PAS domain S-box-containing protein
MAAQRTLLLVDDSPDILAALELLLREDGRRILTAESAEEGLRLLALHAVDVVISDLRMGPVSGLEFLSRVKERYPGTVRMLLSGDAATPLLTGAISGGAIHKFLTKPWDNVRLRATVREAFSLGAGPDGCLQSDGAGCTKIAGCAKDPQAARHRPADAASVLTGAGRDVSKAVKVLVVEDSEDAAALAMRVLRRGGFEPQHERVESAAAMRAALERQSWDAVISDFKLPEFSGLDALAILRATGLDIPFILVSGSVGEETAAQLMKAGAHDYLLKENLARLAPALERELKEAEVRAAHREAQRELSESEARFRSLTEMSSDFYWESDVEHRLTQRASANRKLSTVSAFQRGAQIGERRWEIPFLSPDEAGWQAHRAVLDAHLPFRGFEISRLGADGTERHISLNGDPVFDASGVFKGYRGIGTDITERKRAEAELRESEARFRSLAALSSDWYWEQDANFRFTVMSGGLVNKGNFAVNKALGKTRWELPIELSESEWAAHRATLEAHKAFADFEYSIVTNDGSVRYYSVRGEPVFDEQGRFVGYRGTGNDITERKRAEEALAQFKQTLDQTQDSVFMFREDDFRFIYVNDGAKRQVGYSEAEMLRMTPLDIKPEFTLERFRQMVRPLRDGTQASLDFETVHRHKDGHDFPVEISLQYLRNERRAPVFVAIVRDITERKRADRLLHQIMEGTASTTGAEFMRTLTRTLAEALGVRYAFVGEFVSPARDRLRVISLWNGLEHAEAAEAAVAGTPAGMVAEQAEYFCQSGVQDLFPQDDDLVRFGVNAYLGIRLQSSKGEPLGLLTVMHTRKLEHEALARSVLRIFAARASAELERLQSTAALERSEQRFAKAFRSSPLAVVLTRLSDGKVLDVNEAAAELVGRTRQEMLGRTTPELGFWVDTADRERALEELRRTGTVRGFEHVIRRKSGETRLVQDWVERIELEGEPCVVGSLLDVTEARHAAAALHESEAQMRLVTENLPAMIAYFDQDRRVRYANPRYVDFYAGKGADIQGWHLRQVVGDRSWATIEDQVARVLSGEPVTYERETVRADGEPRSLTIDLVPHRAESGEILGAYTLAFDITKRKRAEKKLRKRDAQLRLITENMPAAVAYIDRDLVIQVANQRYVELRSAPGVEVIGRHVRDVAGEKAWPELAKKIAKVFAGESVVYERTLERPDGERRDIEVHFEPDRSAGGEVRGYYAFILDITERKRAEEALRRFRVALDNSADMILLIDRTTMRYVDVNETVCRLLGYSREEMCGMGPQDVLPASREELERSYDELIANPSIPGTMRSYYRCKDGSALPFESTRHVLRSGDGYLIAAISRDIRASLAAEHKLRESEARFRNLTELSSDFYWEQDEQFRFVERIGPVHEQQGRYPLNQGIGKTRWEIPALNMTEADWAKHRADLEAHREFRDLVIERPGEAGFPRFISTSGQPIFDREGRFKGYRGVGKDITAQKLAEQALRLRDRALEASVNAIMITDSSKEDNPIVYVNPAFERNTGYTAAEVQGRNPRFLLGTDTDQPGLEALRIARAEQREGSALLRNYRKDGTQFWNELRIAPVRDSQGRVTHFVGVQNDVTERISYQAELERQANFDSLTGLANRNLLADRLRQAIVRAERSGRLGAVLFLDLDRFKVINDSLGHAMGDRVLAQLGWRLSEAVRGDDTVARTGGDEFVVVLADLAREEDVAIVAQKLLGIVAEPVRIDGHEFLIATSIGAAVFPRDGSDPDTLLKHADSALYRAKDGGRGGVAFFAQEMNDRAVNYFNLERDLRHALERGEFLLHYQPIISMASGEITGAEALIRWRREPGKMVSPMDFIPIAEESGLIVPIGAWVLREAATRACEWNADGRRPLSVAVNLSARQFRDPKLVEIVREALAATGLEPRLLNLEITESTVMHNAEEAIAALLALREIGVSLSVDDFGTGYSSLSYLKRLPLDHLKVDRSFVKDIPGNSDDVAITRAVIELAHSLELEVVAEGVETEEQRKFLLGQGCEYAQGYLFSKPIELEAFQALVKGRGDSAPIADPRPRPKVRKR